MIPADFRQARLTLGLSAERMAGLIGASDGRMIRRWESGESRIPGPAARLLRVLLLARDRGWDLSSVLGK